MSLAVTDVASDEAGRFGQPRLFVRGFHFFFLLQNRLRPGMGLNPLEPSSGSLYCSEGPCVWPRKLFFLRFRKVDIGGPGTRTPGGLSSAG